MVAIGQLCPGPLECRRAAVAADNGDRSKCGSGSAAEDGNGVLAGMEICAKIASCLDENPGGLQRLG